MEHQTVVNGKYQNDIVPLSEIKTVNILEKDNGDFSLRAQRNLVNGGWLRLTIGNGVVTDGMTLFVVNMGRR